MLFRTESRAPKIGKCAGNLREHSGLFQTFRRDCSSRTFRGPRTSTDQRACRSFVVCAAEKLRTLILCMGRKSHGHNIALGHARGSCVCQLSARMRRGIVRRFMTDSCSDAVSVDGKRYRGRHWLAGPCMNVDSQLSACMPPQEGAPPHPSSS